MFKILDKGGYQAVNENHGNSPSAYYLPNENSGERERAGWENAKRLAASLYALVSQIDQIFSFEPGDNKSRADINRNELNEQLMRRVLESLIDSQGNPITNMIGGRDSFMGYQVNYNGAMLIDDGTGHGNWFYYM